MYWQRFIVTEIMTKHSGKVGDRHPHHRGLEHRVGEIVPDIQSRIRRLSIEELENLPNLRKKVLLPGAGHWIQQERSTEVNQLLIEFLAGLDT